MIETISILERFDKKRMANVHLFVSQEGEESKKIANLFAKLLFCETEAKKICGVCSSCTSIEDGKNADVRIIEADGATIKLNQIKLIRKDSAVSSHLGGKKLYVIFKADTLTEEAANALLKILEEPSADTYFALFSEKVETVLPTIISRCRVVRFALTGFKEFPEEIKSAVKEIVELIENLTLTGFDAVFQLKKLTSDREKLKEIFEGVLHYYREMIRNNDKNNAIDIISIITETLRWLEGNANVQLAFEVMCIRIVNSIKSENHE